MPQTIIASLVALVSFVPMDTVASRYTFNSDALRERFTISRPIPPRARISIVQRPVEQTVQQTVVQQPVQQQSQPVQEAVTQSAQPATQTTQPQPAQQAQPTAQQNYTQQVEQEVLRYTNIERAKAGLAALTWDSRLANVARTHSIDMLVNNYFAHNNQSGCSSSCRVTNAGYAWSAVAENIHWMSGYTLSATEAAQKIVTDWMNSPPHRAAILNGTYTHSGTGISQSGSTIMSTSLYSLPR